MKKFIQGTFKITNLKRSYIEVSNVIVAAANKRDLNVETYEVEDDSDLYVDYYITGSSSGLCVELLKELKQSARLYGKVVFVSERQGVSRR